MSDDKLADIYPIPVEFVPGQQPTSAFLNAWADQVDNAFEILSRLIGDFFSHSPSLNALDESGGYKGHAYITNLSRMLGNAGWLNPMLPKGLDAYVTEYVGVNWAGKKEALLTFPAEPVLLDNIAGEPAWSVADFGFLVLTGTNSSAQFASGNWVKNKDSGRQFSGDTEADSPTKLGTGFTGQYRKLMTQFPIASDAYLTYKIKTHTEVGANAKEGFTDDYHEQSGANVVPSLAQIAQGDLCELTIPDAASPDIARITLPKISHLINPTPHASGPPPGSDLELDANSVLDLTPTESGGTGRLRWYLGTGAAAQIVTSWQETRTAGGDTTGWQTFGLPVQQADFIWPRYKIPSWIYNLALNVGDEFPKGLIRIYRKTALGGTTRIQHITAAPEEDLIIRRVSETEIEVQFSAGVSAQVGEDYVVAFAGVSIAEALGHTRIAIKSHKHDGDDESNLISAGDLARRFDPQRYRHSQLEYNLFPQYFSRAGYTYATGTEAPYDPLNASNAMTGDIVFAPQIRDSKSFPLFADQFQKGEQTLHASLDQDENDPDSHTYNWFWASSASVHTAANDATSLWSVSEDTHGLVFGKPSPIALPFGTVDPYDAKAYEAPTLRSRHFGNTRDSETVGSASATEGWFFGAYTAHRRALSLEGSSYKDLSFVNAQGSRVQDRMYIHDKYPTSLLIRRGALAIGMPLNLSTEPWILREDLYDLHNGATDSGTPIPGNFPDGIGQLQPYGFLLGADQLIDMWDDTLFDRYRQGSSVMILAPLLDAGFFYPGIFAETHVDSSYIANWDTVGNMPAGYLTYDANTILLGREAEDQTLASIWAYDDELKIEGGDTEFQKRNKKDITNLSSVLTGSMILRGSRVDNLLNYRPYEDSMYYSAGGGHVRHPGPQIIFLDDTVVGKLTNKTVDDRWVDRTKARRPDLDGHRYEHDGRPLSLTSYVQGAPQNLAGRDIPSWSGGVHFKTGALDYKKWRTLALETILTTPETTDPNTFEVTKVEITNWTDPKYMDVSPTNAEFVAGRVSSLESVTGDSYVTKDLAVDKTVRAGAFLATHVGIRSVSIGGEQLAPVAALRTTSKHSDAIFSGGNNEQTTLVRRPSSYQNPGLVPITEYTIFQGMQVKETDIAAVDGVAETDNTYRVDVTAEFATGWSESIFTWPMFFHHPLVLGANNVTLAPVVHRPDIDPANTGGQTYGMDRILSGRRFCGIEQFLGYTWSSIERVLNRFPGWLDFSWGTDGPAAGETEDAPQNDSSAYNAQRQVITGTCNAIWWNKTNQFVLPVIQVGGQPVPEDHPAFGRTPQDKGGWQQIFSSGPDSRKTVQLDPDGNNDGWQDGVPAQNIFPDGNEDEGAVWKSGSNWEGVEFYFKPLLPFKPTPGDVPALSHLFYPAGTAYAASGQADSGGEHLVPYSARPEVHGRLVYNIDHLIPYREIDYLVAHKEMAHTAGGDLPSTEELDMRVRLIGVTVTTGYDPVAAPGNGREGNIGSRTFETDRSGKALDCSTITIDQGTFSGDWMDDEKGLRITGGRSGRAWCGNNGEWLWPRFVSGEQTHEFSDPPVGCAGVTNTQSTRRDFAITKGHLKRPGFIRITRNPQNTTRGALLGAWSINDAQVSPQYAGFGGVTQSYTIPIRGGGSLPMQHDWDAALVGGTPPADSTSQVAGNEDHHVNNGPDPRLDPVVFENTLMLPIERAQDLLPNLGGHAHPRKVPISYTYTGNQSPFSTNGDGEVKNGAFASQSNTTHYREVFSPLHRHQLEIASVIPGTVVLEVALHFALPGATKGASNVAGVPGLSILNKRREDPNA